MNKKHIITSISIVIVLLVGIYLLNFSYADSIVIIAKDNKRISNNIAIMLETAFGSGTYEQSEQILWPTRGYVYNAEKTYCENGSEVSFNEATHKVSVNSRLTDKCYVYFDVEPPDIQLTLNNAPTTYGKTITPSCTGATVTYDNKLNQLEVTAMNSDKMKCRMNYTTPSGTTPLNSYLISLSGTTQGDGQLTHEIGVISSSNTTWSKVPMTYQNTSGNAMSFSNNEYTGTETIERTGSYHKFFPQTDGYYRMCYSIPTSSYTTNNSSYKNYIITYALNVTSSSYQYIYGTYNNGAVTTGCMDYGYISTSDFIYLRNYYYDNNLTVYFEKASSYDSFDTGYRYQGRNPNNYVAFNNELWRIIGVFDASSHGQSGQNLVKIIRDESLGGVSFDTNSALNWSSTKLYHLLNDQYYDWETNKDGAVNNCYVSSSVKKTCDYSYIGIKDGYRGMIANVTWYLGGGGKSGYTTYTPYFIYSYERDNNAVYSGKSASATGYIGLMYESDYLLSVSSADCSRSNTHTQASQSACRTNKWLYSYSNEYTITPKSDTNTNVWYITNGTMSSNPNSNGWIVRPTLYLSSSVYKVSGTGTISDPYIIGM